MATTAPSQAGFVPDFVVSRTIYSMSVLNKRLGCASAVFSALTRCVRNTPSSQIPLASLLLSPNALSLYSEYVMSHVLEEVGRLEVSMLEEEVAGLVGGW